MPVPAASIRSRKGCRFATFLAATAGAVLWNGALFWVYQALLGNLNQWTLADWGVLVVLMPFAAGGFGLAGIAVFLGAPLANPRVTLEMFPSRAGPGETVEIAWRFDGRLDRVRSVTITLEGREEARRTGPSGSRSKAAAFRRQQIYRTTDPDRIRAGGTSFRLPDDLVPSFGGRHSRLAWYVSITSGVGRWPHVRQELEYTIVPKRT